MNPHCRIEILGPLRVIRAEQATAHFATQKAAGLLAYLALRLGPQPREQLIDIFWPDMELPAGRNNLSTTLSSLRRMLESGSTQRGRVLVTTHAQVGLNPAAVTTDIAEFEGLLCQAEDLSLPGVRAETWERALALYRGEFQAGNYQDWAVREAERLQATYAKTLGRLADDLDALGRLREALDTARHRLAIDLYAEDAHLGVICRLARAGQEAAARAACRRMEAMFQEEFGSALPAAVQQAVQVIFSQPSVPRASVALSAPPDGPMVAVARLGGAPAAPHSLAGTTPLPFWLGRFVGREAEMRHLLALLEPPDARRLVTLTGAGGTGKTRLAAEAGRAAAARLGWQCSFVALADLTEPGQAASQIAQALMLPPAPSVPQEQIVAFFQEREAQGAPPFLLILDNLEQLLAEKEVGKETLAGVVRTLLGQTTQVTIWGTSRRRIGLSGEQQMPVEPLPMPELPSDERANRGTISVDLTALAGVPSVALYLERARAVRPDFGLTPTNAESVAALCRMLEGSPLALELAASWVRSLPPRQMWERLSRGETLPEGRGTDAPPRHHSVSAALEWSWRLLPDNLRRLLARLSVFRGGWSAEDADTVCGEPETLACLADLQEASLLTAQETDDGDVRYAMLESVRMYAAARLEEFGADDFEQAHYSHTTHFASLAARSVPHMRGPEQAQWLATLDVSQDNLRAALEWSLAHANIDETGLKMAGSLWAYWQRRGRATEGRLWLARALALGRLPTEARADALLASGALAFSQGDYPEAEGRYNESLAIWRERGDEAGISAVLNNLAVIANDQGRYDDARALLGEHIVIRRRLGDNTSVARSLFNFALTWQRQGDWDTAEKYHAEALALRRQVGDEAGIGASLGCLATIASERGDHETAATLYAEALAVQRRLNNAVGMADALNGLGDVQTAQGGYADALSLHCEALHIRRLAGDRRGGASSLECLAAVHLKMDSPARAARLMGAAQGLRALLGCPLPPAQQGHQTQLMEVACAALGTEVFGSDLAAGRALTWEQVSDEALKA